MRPSWSADRPVPEAAAYEPIIIKDELTPGELAFVDSHRDPETFPEMVLIQAQTPAVSALRTGGARHRLRR